MINKQKYLSTETGASLIEYSLFAAVIAVVCLGSIRLFSVSTASSICDSATKMSNLHSISSNSPLGYEIDSDTGDCTKPASLDLSDMDGGTECPDICFQPEDCMNCG